MLGWSQLIPNKFAPPATVGVISRTAPHFYTRNQLQDMQTDACGASMQLCGFDRWGGAAHQHSRHRCGRGLLAAGAGAFQGKRGGAEEDPATTNEGGAMLLTHRRERPWQRLPARILWRRRAHGEGSSLHGVQARRPHPRVHLYDAGPRCALLRAPGIEPLERAPCYGGLLSEICPFGDESGQVGPNLDPVIAGVTCAVGAGARLAARPTCSAVGRAIR